MAYTFHWLSTTPPGPESLTTPVLTDLSAGGVCKFSFPNDTRAYAYRIFVNGAEQGYPSKWTATLADGVYTVTMNDSAFPADGTYRITAQAYVLDGSYADSDMSEPIIFTKQSAKRYIITNNGGVWASDDLLTWEKINNDVDSPFTKCGDQYISISGTNADSTYTFNLTETNDFSAYNKKTLVSSEIMPLAPPVALPFNGGFGSLTGGGKINLTSGYLCDAALANIYSNSTIGNSIRGDTYTLYIHRTYSDKNFTLTRVFDDGTKTTFTVTCDKISGSYGNEEGMFDSYYVDGDNIYFIVSITNKPYLYKITPDSDKRLALPTSQTSTNSYNGVQHSQIGKVTLDDKTYIIAAWGIQEYYSSNWYSNFYVSFVDTELTTKISNQIEKKQGASGSGYNTYIYGMFIGGDHTISILKYNEIIHPTLSGNTVTFATENYITKPSSTLSGVKLTYTVSEQQAPASGYTVTYAADFINDITMHSSPSDVQIDFYDRNNALLVSHTISIEATGTNGYSTYRNKAVSGVDHVTFRSMGDPNVEYKINGGAWVYSGLDDDPYALDLALTADIVLNAVAAKF